MWINIVLVLGLSELFSLSALSPCHLLPFYFILKRWIWVNKMSVCLKLRLGIRVFTLPYWKPSRPTSHCVSHAPTIKSQNAARHAAVEKTRKRSPHTLGQVEWQKPRVQLLAPWCCHEFAIMLPWCCHGPFRRLLPCNFAGKYQLLLGQPLIFMGMPQQMIHRIASCAERILT